MTLSHGIALRNDRSGGYFPTRIAFRRLYFDGLAVGKFELGLSTRTRRDLFLSKSVVRTLVDGYLNLAVRLRESGKSYKQCLLGYSPEYLARLYYYATTASSEEVTQSKVQMVRPGIPLLFLDCQNREAFPPYWSRQLTIEGYAFNLYNCLVPFHGKNFRLWLINNPSSYRDDIEAARRLRIYLLRLNAEHESLRLVLRSILAGNIEVKPGTELSDKLQNYFNEATRRIGILDQKSSSQTEDGICEIARASINTISPGQRDALVDVLARINIRKNIFRKVEDYINKWVNVTIIENAEEVVMGDVFKDINQSIIATRGAIAEGVITLKNQGKDDLANAISELDKTISSMNSNILSNEKKAECADLLHGIADQAKKPEPNKSIIRSLGSSLLSIIGTIKPIAEAAGKGIEFIRQLCA